MCHLLLPPHPTAADDVEADDEESDADEVRGACPSSAEAKAGLLKVLEEGDLDAVGEPDKPDGEVDAVSSLLAKQLEL